MFCSKHVFVITGLLLFIHECSFASASDAVDDEEGGTGPFSGDEEGGSPYGGDEEEDDLDDMHGVGGGGGGGGGGAGHVALGAISLSNYTFDKWISLASYKFFVKFDVAYPYGDLQDEWEKLAPMAQNVSQFFIAEVVVELEDGVEVNDDKLAKRYNLLKQENLPAMLFFNGLEDWTTYTGPNVTEAITSWLRRKGVKMPSAGTIPDLDDEVFSSIKGGLTDARVEAMQILVDAKFADEKKAAWYPKIMRKMREKGTAYADAEGGRLEKLLTGSMAEEKRSDLTDKLSILGVFQEAIGKGKDEL